MSDKYSSALTKRTSDHEPGHSRRDDDSDRYGGSRREGGNRARYQGEDKDRYQEYETFGGLKERRFIPCTMRTILRGDERFLCEVFKVSMEKLQDWCDEEYIRIDRTKDPNRDPSFLNVDPLRHVVPKGDWERYEKQMRRWHNEWEAREHMERMGKQLGGSRSEYGEEGEEEEEDE